MTVLLFLSALKFCGSVRGDGGSVNMMSCSACGTSHVEPRKQVGVADVIPVKVREREIVDVGGRVADFGQLRSSRFRGRCISQRAGSAARRETRCREPRRSPTSACLWDEQSGTRHRHVSSWRDLPFSADTEWYREYSGCRRRIRRAAAISAAAAWIEAEPAMRARTQPARQEEISAAIMLDMVISVFRHAETRNVDFGIVREA